MVSDLDSKILVWIDEEGTQGARLGEAVPINLLIIRLALSHVGEDVTTKSVELSLSAFDRANLIRVIRANERKGFLRIHKDDGSLVSELEMKDFLAQSEREDRPRGRVSLSDKGKVELVRIRRMAQEGATN
jgi:hypothetical protein